MLSSPRLLLHSCLGASVLLSAIAACGDPNFVLNNDGGGKPGADTTVAGVGGGTVATFAGTGDATSGMGGASNVLDVTPSAPQTLVVTLGQPLPTLTYAATYNGAPTSAAWSVDKGNIGAVLPGPSATTIFTPKGTTGGPVKVIAGLNQQLVEREIVVQITGTQNGFDPTDPLLAAQVPTSVADLTNGGGVNGVGGEGLGGEVLDPTLVTALENPMDDGSADGLRWLYPYDGTVWPRSLPAPNLMWDWTIGDADAVRIELWTTSGAFTWSGTFARPAILAQTGGPFVRHPIPQNIWKMATDTAGGVDRITVRLTVARGGIAYGPLEQTWTIAPARLSGTIYYNSYGTQLAKNLGGAVGGDGRFGGAVLSIRAGDAGPKLTAGGNGGTSECRVCHSVAADGSRLVTQWGNDTSISSAYDLSPAGVTAQTQLANGAEFPGLSPDGSMMLAPTGALYPLPDAMNPLPSSGLTDVSTQLVTSTFAPAGNRVAFGMLGSATIANPKQKLVVMDFDPATYTFANPLVIADYTGQPAEARPGWPAFFPDGNSVIFHTQIAAGIDGNNLFDLRSRKGARAEISWVAAQNPGAVTPLNQLNGKDANGVSYLPALTTPVTLACTGDGSAVGGIDTAHQNDVQLNYEPTVNPAASGGYAWVVFTSRRLYGSVANIPPFCSDPRGVNLVENITPKKLWVAAVDINGDPLVDASHPAFYLPGQELLAGNSRGFWTLDPCKSDGNGCEAGDECCNGYCQPNAEGELVCSNIPPNTNCSGPQESCEDTGDCCDPTNLCVNGFCAIVPPA